MYIAEAIGKFDKLKPNQYSNEQKVGWLSDLDGNLVNIVFRSHEDDPMAGWKPYNLYDENVDTIELLVPDPYSELYFSYLSYKVDYYNGEYERFNNSALVYNTQLQEFMNYWNREHKPKQNNRVNMK